MRCKIHISDRSSSLGVCASCLRERLFTLIDTQTQSHSQFIEQDRRKSDPHPPPLIFPRSVSPYICRRSDDSSWNHHQLNDRRFYSTPQIGPTTITESSSTTTIRKKKHSKFNLFSNFFRSSSKSNETEQRIPDPRVSSISIETSTSSPISSTWFSSLVSSRRKNNQQSKSSSSSSTQNYRHPCRFRDRGMSPSCEDEENHHESPSVISGYFSESSPGWRKSTPVHQQCRRRGQSQQHRSVSGIAFCLSPLVRASPNNHRSQNKDITPGSVGISGEIGRVSVKPKPNLSTAASLCANRSRKIANFGRYNDFNP